MSSATKKVQLSGMVYVKDPRDLDTIKKLRARVAEMQDKVKAAEKLERELQKKIDKEVQISLNREKNVYRWKLQELKQQYRWANEDKARGIRKLVQDYLDRDVAAIPLEITNAGQ